MDEDTEPYENEHDDVEQVDESADSFTEPAREQSQVPLSALQKERKKRQELEQELSWERKRQQQSAQPIEEDNSRYESATKQDLANSQLDAVRMAEERMWIRENREKAEKVDTYLSDFLKQRPNLASAIKDAPNRYEEAYTLMEALTPRQQQQMKAPTAKKEAPNAPGGVPKVTAMNQAVDVMNMDDSEFSAWRQQQKKRR